MPDHYSIPLTQLVKEFDLKVAYTSTDYEKVRLTAPEVSRPGLQLAGYLDHFEPMRLQVLGNVEMSYLNKLTAAERYIIFDRFFSYKIPALLVSRNQTLGLECIALAKKHNITLLRSDETTSNIVSSIISYLKSALAPSITRHGVLMEIYGEGVLLIGDSGIGKSETAIELIKRGHRLIADDAVELKRINSYQIIGTAPALIKDYIELRGIGIVNVAKLFGIGAVKQENVINLVVNIVPWDKQENYDRLGLEEQHTEFFGIKIPQYTIPVTPGRNLAVIMEVAAMNNRQRRMGYNAALEFTEQVNRYYSDIAKADN